MPTVTRLYPDFAEDIPLHGLYLSHDLRGVGEGRPFVYTNFVQSLDGRISENDPHSGRRRVPEAIANDHDWRLYMELLAQADAVLTTARHLNAVSEGRHGELLCITEADHPDLLAWRQARGLSAVPVCIAVSQRLHLPIEALRQRHAGEFAVVTTEQADDGAVQSLETAGVQVVTAGAGPGLRGRDLISAVAGLGHQRIYSIAGPRLLHTLLDDDQVDRLYLTWCQRLLGGERYDTLVAGPPLSPPRDFQLHQLYLDHHAPAGGSQLMVSMNRRGT